MFVYYSTNLKKNKVLFCTEVYFPVNPLAITTNPAK